LPPKRKNEKPSKKERNKEYRPPKLKRTAKTSSNFLYDGEHFILGEFFVSSLKIVSI